MKKVLIIEDDPIVAHVYRTRLEKVPYDVAVAEDGKMGFYQLHDYCPDVVLLDLMLPRMNGIDILKKIRADAKFCKMPIIVFTNAYVPNMINEAFGAGANQVFNKADLNPRLILDAIQNAILYTNGSSGSKAAAVSGVGTGASNRGTPATAAQGASAVQTPAQILDTEDSGDRADLLKRFNEAAPEILASLRRTLLEFSKAQEESVRLPLLLDLYRKVHLLTGGAGLAGLRTLSQMASAVEVLLQELHDKPKNINASALRTMAHALDFVGQLIQKGIQGDILAEKPVNILVVDDEVLSRRAVDFSLEKAGLKSTSVEDPKAALKLVAETTFDLIFLDVQMPGVDGFELCTRIRALPANQTTPVIFVTNLTDFNSRARSSLSGGTDFIAKPFLFIELSVKALTCIIRSRLARR